MTTAATPQAGIRIPQNQTHCGGGTATDPESVSMAQLQIQTSPGCLAVVLTVFLAHGRHDLFAFLDRTVLIERAVPRPFHCACSFLSSRADVIGRSVIDDAQASELRRCGPLLPCG